MISSKLFIEGVGALLRQTAQAELMPRFAGFARNEVTEKASSFDVVSEADEAAEIMISRGLLKLFPTAVIVGEEACARHRQRESQIGEAELALLVDPIDGTKNFVSGTPLFGIMVAAVAKGEVVLGAIHDPVTGSTAFAARGEGAWIEGDVGERKSLSVSSVENPAEMHAVAGANFMPEPMRSTFLSNARKLALSFWLRCCAHEYRMAAAGHCDLLIYNKLSPWDHAAGWLLHNEAGGYSAHLDGMPYSVTRQSGGLMCAPNRDAWMAAYNALFNA